MFYTFEQFIAGYDSDVTPAWGVSNHRNTLVSRKSFLRFTINKTTKFLISGHLSGADGVLTDRDSHAESVLCSYCHHYAIDLCTGYMNAKRQIAMEPSMKRCTKRGWAGWPQYPCHRAHNSPDCSVERIGNQNKLITSDVWLLALDFRMFNA